jgi:hypothetical protein
MITASKIEKWRTSDGMEHTTREMAHQHIAFVDLSDLLSERMSLFDDPTAIVNFMWDHRVSVRAYLDACDAMEMAAS